MRLLGTFIGSPFFLALMVTLLAVPFLPEMFDKYEAEQLKKEGLHRKGRRQDDRYRYYADLNGDGKSHRVDIWIKERFKALEVQKPQGGVMGHINLPPSQSFPGPHHLYFCDADADGTKEVHYLSKSSDSLFLNTVEPFSDTSLSSSFIDTIHYRTDEGYKVRLRQMKCCDLEGNGEAELSFLIATAFSLQPRALYIHDPNGEGTVRSPMSGAHMGDFSLFDLTGDGKKELLLDRGGAFANIPPELEIPYSDTSAWLMALDRDLEFLFEPVEFPNFKSFLKTAPYRSGEERYIAALYQYRGDMTEKTQKLYLFDAEGEQVLERPLEDQRLGSSRKLFSSPDGRRLYLMGLDGMIHELNKELEKVDQKRIGPKGQAFRLLKKLDFDGDGEQELAFFGKENKNLYLAQQGLSHSVKLEVPAEEPFLKTHKLTLKKTGDGDPLLSVQNGGQWYLFAYNSNPLYYFKYAIYGGIYGVVLLFLYGVQKTATYKLERDKRKLEELVDQRTNELQEKNLQLEEKNRAITDSIDYARKIQNALLQSEERISAKLPEHFILFKPQAQVSGDLYWAKAHKGYFYIAAVDCTGHGVPGAFMSMLGISQLNEIMNTDEELTPGYILTELRDRVVRELSGNDPESAAKDGMDAALVKIPIANSESLNEENEGVEVEFAGAQNPLYVIRKGVAEHPPSASMEYRGSSLEGDPIKPFKKSSDGIEIKGDKQPVGYDEYAKDAFTTVKLRLQKGDMCYVSSDGYADQFGGPKGKKFRYGPFKQVLASIHEKALEEQKLELDKTFEDWKAASEQEQIDDVVVVGVRL